MGLYSKLRELGHTRKESLKKTINYELGCLMPFPIHDPVEFQVEEALKELEDMVYFKSYPNHKLENGARTLSRLCSGYTDQNHLDDNVEYLNEELSFENRKTFSEPQKERYNKVLEQLANDNLGK